MGGFLWIRFLILGLCASNWISGKEAEIEREAENDECVDDRKPYTVSIEFFQVFILHGTHPFSVLFIIISFQNIGKLIVHASFTLNFRP